MLLRSGLWGATLRLGVLSAGALACAAQTPVAPRAENGAAQVPERIERLNKAFLEHLSTLGPEQATTVATVRRNYEERYRGRDDESFVPDALAVLYPDFRAAQDAFLGENYADAVRLAEPLLSDADPFLAANAGYIYARALVERGLLEETERFLSGALGESETAMPTSAPTSAPRSMPPPVPSVQGAAGGIAAYTPHAPELWFMLASAQAANLRFEDASRTLERLNADYPDASEAVRAGARQLALEIERRDRRPLATAAELMDYSGARLKVADATPPVRQRQQQVIDLLDRMIQEMQQQEQQQQQNQAAGGRGALNPRRMPSRPAEESRVAEGAAQVGQLHAAAKADPGKAWGKLPPAERDRILQSLRDRFPSRYRQLVEQYYRSLAEQKSNAP